MQRKFRARKLAELLRADIVNPTHRRLLGESLREIGVLVLVFVPLDMVLREHADSFIYPSWMFWLRWLSMAQWVELCLGAAGISLLYYGIKIEAKAAEEQEGGPENDILDSGV
jgi:hypothetical protein